MQLRLDDRHDAEDIPAVGLVTLGVVDDTAADGLGCPTLAVEVFSAEGYLILVPFCGETVAVEGQTDICTLLCDKAIFIVDVLSHTSVASRPSEGTDAKSFDG